MSDRYLGLTPVEWRVYDAIQAAVALGEWRLVSALADLYDMLEAGHPLAIDVLRGLWPEIARLTVEV